MNSWNSIQIEKKSEISSIFVTPSAINQFIKQHCQHSTMDNVSEKSDCYAFNEPCPNVCTMRFEQGKAMMEK
jgi:hypothetical protein